MKTTGPVFTKPPAVMGRPSESKTGAKVPAVEEPPLEDWERVPWLGLWGGGAGVCAAVGKPIVNSRIGVDRSFNTRILRLVAGPLRWVTKHFVLCPEGIALMYGSAHWDVKKCGWAARFRENM